MSGIKVFQELYLRHARGPSAVREAVLRQLGTQWVHRPELEDEIDIPGEPNVIALVRPQTKVMQGVGLWLFEESDGRYRVTNIVPLKSGELGATGYNEALQQFVRDVVKPAGDKLGLLYELSEDEMSLEDWADPETAEALKRFSRLANKSTGRSHPMDGQRWVAFLLVAHTQKTSLDSDQLTRWLVEVERWPAEIASELASEYELSRTLLSKYDEAH